MTMLTSMWWMSRNTGSISTSMVKLTFCSTKPPSSKSYSSKISWSLASPSSSSRSRSTSKSVSTNTFLGLCWDSREKPDRQMHQWNKVKNYKIYLQRWGQGKGVCWVPGITKIMSLVNWILFFFIWCWFGGFPDLETPKLYRVDRRAEG